MLRSWSRIFPLIFGHRFWSGFFALYWASFLVPLFHPEIWASFLVPLFAPFWVSFMVQGFVLCPAFLPWILGFVFGSAFFPLLGIVFGPAFVPSLEVRFGNSFLSFLDFIFGLNLYSFFWLALLGPFSVPKTVIQTTGPKKGNITEPWINQIVPKI